MRIAILARPNRKNGAERLLQAAKKRGHKAQIIDYTECYCNIEKDNQQIYYEGKPLPHFDAIIPRIAIESQSYGSVIIRQFEMTNTFTTTGSLAFIRARDKLRSMQLLARAGIDIPKTVVARQTRDVAGLIEAVGGTPLIIKVARGSQGVGVVLAETRKAARSIIQAFYSQNVNILVQEFIAEANGEDIRVFIVDGEVVAAMKRKTLDEDEFRSNINLGGVGEPVELTPKEKRVALKAAKTMHLPIAGVDILRAKRGPLVMEVNAFPMLNGIEAATKIDIADEIIRYVERSVGVKPKLDKVGV
ncbi:MAG TPA: 30S ribosomal protein S6--L-glutamate ligase [Candidatus Saccharimonadales bacterium]|nr:30S ribosomal protein S6--L-glutamate ligase [Candidatus Saccharimonadales bacterium]